MTSKPSVSKANFAVVVLAAGKGTRMKSSLPKVLHPIAGRPMVLHALDAAEELTPNHLVTIVGHKADSVRDAITEHFPDAQFAEQTQQLGTGHAVQQSENLLEDFDGHIIVLCGDVPLITPEMLLGLARKHLERENAVTVLTTTVDDPSGLGRVRRGGKKGGILSIVEHKDATKEEREIDEINAGIYAVRCPLIFDLLRQVKNDNSQNEYYLPDILSLALQDGLKVGTYHTADGRALLGVNSRAQLASSEAIMQNRLRKKAMDDGATLSDPATTYFSHDTQLGQDVTVGPNTCFGANVSVGSNVTIEGNAHLANTQIHDGAHLLPFCHIDGAHLRSNAAVGPFTRLRPGTHLQSGAKAGTFVEVKKSTIGKDSKVNHLSYIGDTEIGENSNIGAGTITANYDGVSKHKTTIGDRVHVGSLNALIAPVTLHNDAMTGAGATIIKDVPGNTLSMTKSEQLFRINMRAQKDDSA